MTIVGYDNILIEKEITSIVVVKNDQDGYFIWLKDTRDIDAFKTTGYILKLIDNKIVPTPVNEGGRVPDNFDDVIQTIRAKEPNWSRKI
jgi:hypothetical protein